MTRRMFSYLLAVAVAMATMAPLTACSSSQVVNVVSTISKQLPAALTLASSLSAIAGNPALADALGVAANAVAQDGPVLQATIAAWQANQSSSNLQKIAAVVSTIASTVNAQVLAANKLVNTQAEQLALLSLTGLAAIFNGFALSLGSVNKQAAKMARNMAVPYSEVASLIPRWQKQQAAAAYGVSLEAAGL